jgi:hypothetical protein
VESEDVTRAELSGNDCATLFQKEMANIREEMEESFAVSNFVQGEYVLVNLARRSIFYNIAQVSNYSELYEY